MQPTMLILEAICQGVRLQIRIRRNFAGGFSSLDREHPLPAIFGAPVPSPLDRELAREDFLIALGRLSLLQCDWIHVEPVRH